MGCEPLNETFGVVDCGMQNWVRGNPLTIQVLAREGTAMATKCGEGEWIAITK